VMGCGGVIRDENGKWLDKFAKYLGQTNDCMTVFFFYIIPQ